MVVGDSAVVNRDNAHVNRCWGSIHDVNLCTRNKLVGVDTLESTKALTGGVGGLAVSVKNINRKKECSLFVLYFVNVK